MAVAQLLSPDANGVVKVVEQAGDLTAQRPAEGDTVSLHLVGAVVGDDSAEPFEDTRRRRQPLTFIVGKGEVVLGLEMAVSSMRPGEVSVVTCSPAYAFGEAGRPPVVPPDASVQWHAELLHIKRKIPWVQMPLDEQLAASSQLKDKGNRYFKDEKYGPALLLYKRSLDVIYHAKQDPEVAGSLANLYSNMAICHLKTGEPGEALACCDEALQHDLDHVKALYRRGIALEELRRLQEALQSAQLVLKLDPGNKPAAQLARRLKTKIAKEDGQERDLYVSMTQPLFS